MKLGDVKEPPAAPAKRKRGPRKPPPPSPGELIVGKTVARVVYGPEDWVMEDLTIVFTDGSEWSVGTCSCCGLSDGFSEKKAGTR